MHPALGKAQQQSFQSAHTVVAVNL